MVAGSDGDLDSRQPRDLSTPAIYTSSVSTIVQVSPPLLGFEQHRRSQYEANRGTRLGKILPNTVDFYFFYQTDNIRRFHTADFVQRTVCLPRL